VNSDTHAKQPTSIVFLHGMFGAPTNWRSAIERLSPQADVHAPALPVFDTPLDANPIEFIGAAARQYIVNARIGRAVLVGNSLGGHIAARLAVLEPHRIAGLVLSGSSGLFERGLERNVPRRPGHEWLRRKISEVFHNPACVTDKMIHEVASVVSDRRFVRQLVRLAQSAKRDSLAAVLPKLAMPVLLVWGENDRITPLATARQFQELLPDSELHTIPQCGHAPMLERPEVFNDLLARFIERCGGVEARGLAATLPPLFANRAAA
jgi:pimeloyl-ACP methyl ester carboxylesterase